MASLHTVQASARSRDVTHSLSTRAPRPTDVRHLTTRRLGRVSPSSRPERYADDLDASRRPHCLSSSQTIDTPASVTRESAPGHTQSSEVERRSVVRTRSTDAALRRDDGPPTERKVSSGLSTHTDPLTLVRRMEASPGTLSGVGSPLRRSYQPPNRDERRHATRINLTMRLASSWRVPRSNTRLSKRRKRPRSGLERRLKGGPGPNGAPPGVSIFEL